MADRKHLAHLQRELHARRTLPEIRLVVDVLNALIDDIKETLVRTTDDRFWLEQGKAQAYMRLRDLIERPSPVPASVTENKYV